MSITTDQINFPYTAVQLTGTINRIPNLYGLLNDFDVFPSAGSISTLVEIRREENTLAVLPAVERGGPATVAKRTPGDTLYFEIPHFPLDDAISPRDLQNMLTVVGASAHPRTLEEEVAKRLFAIRNRHAITLEWVRMGALKGLITDGKGNTIYDLYSAFNLVKPIIYFDLANAAADIVGKCAQLFETIATNLRGETMNGIEVIVSSNFFNAFVEHPKVNKYWLNWQAANQMQTMPRGKVGGQYGRVFSFQQIDFREYYGSAPVNGVSTKFVADGKGHARPLGTMDSFKTHFAPANDIRFVNTPGQEIYISPKILDHGQGVEMHTESNPLAICRRPEVLVEVDIGASA
jgi:hypothetical protein